MFFKKKNKKLFGGRISPSCEYCFNNIEKDGEPNCKISLKIEQGQCKKFAYNPLMRIPKQPPSIEKNSFDENDFSL